LIHINASRQLSHTRRSPTFGLWLDDKCNTKAPGKIVFRRKIKRLALAETFKKLPPCVVGMEACLSAHFVSRALRQLGHEPKIIPSIYVKPFVKGQKNDYNDAEAIAEASLRPNLRSVREKTQDQLDRQACHRVRSRLVSRRTATINQIRALLIELGSPGHV
jgi:transposase